MSIFKVTPSVTPFVENLEVNPSCDLQITNTDENETNLGIQKIIAAQMPMYVEYKLPPRSTRGSTTQTV